MTGWVPPELTETERLELRKPVMEDLDGLFAIDRDPRVWGHYPSLRPTDPAQVLDAIRRWLASWTAYGLGSWTVRLRGQDRVIGHGGCCVRSDAFWNLGYRFDADLHGQGYGTELALEAIRQAHEVRPQLPVVAYMVEHNHASLRVAEKAGLTRVHRGPDAGNPDPTAIRLVYADRPLSVQQLDAVLGRKVKVNWVLDVRERDAWLGGLYSGYEDGCFDS